MESPSGTRATCLETINQLSPALPSPTPPSPKDTIWHPIIESGKQLQPNSSHSIGKMARATQLTSSANIGSLQLCGPCSSLSCSGGARLPPSGRGVTEFRQPLQVQSHLEMPRILVQLGHTQRTWKLAPQTDPKWSPTRSSTRYQDQMSVNCTRRTLRMPSFTRESHAQPSLSNFTRRD